MESVTFPVLLTGSDTLLDFRGCPEGGSTIADRYDVQDCLGVGSTGAVLRALDKSSGVVVAIKIANTATNLQDQKIVREVEIYRRLVASPSRALNLFPRLFDTGKHNNLRYLSFDLGGINLFDILTMACLHPLPKRHLREIGIQLLRGIQFLHVLKIVHTDLKPANIVLRSSEIVQSRRMRRDEFFFTKMELKSVELYIVDFADAVDLRSERVGLVGSNCYRAPEVTLGLPRTTSVDAFAMGCVMAELYLGRPLFHYTETDIERLALVERVLGPFPEAVAERAEQVLVGRFIVDPPAPVRVRFPVPGVDCKAEVKRVMSAWPLSALMFDTQYLQLCMTLMTLDHRHREDVSAMGCLPFLHRCDDDLVLVEPWESRDAVLL